MGAVMGSKRLKAIVVRGSGKYLSLARDPEDVAASASGWRSWSSSTAKLICRRRARRASPPG